MFIRAGLMSAIQGVNGSSAAHLISESSGPRHNANLPWDVDVPLHARADSLHCPSTVQTCDGLAVAAIQTRAKVGIGK
jgi:hypothetical protein